MAEIKEPLFVIQKNPTERVHATVQKFKKKHNMDLRVYYMDDEGEWKPTKKGVSLSMEFLPELKEAVEAIEKEVKIIEDAE